MTSRIREVMMKKIWKIPLFLLLIVMLGVSITVAGVTYTLIISSRWIKVTSPRVEMFIENKIYPLGKTLSILMVTLDGGTFPSSQIFDVRLYDSDYNLFSSWSMGKGFLATITTVPPAYRRTLWWNLCRYDPYPGTKGIFTPPPSGNYYLIGVVVGRWETPESATQALPITIDESTIIPQPQGEITP